MAERLSASRPGRPRGGRARLPAALIAGTVLLSLAAVSVATLHAGESIGELQYAIGSAQRISDTAQDLLLALEGAESAERGFLLTMRPEYLGPYTEATERARHALGSLAHEAETAPWLVPESAALGTLARGKMAKLDRTIAAARAGGRDAALPLVNADAGGSIMGQVGAAVASIDARAAAERQNRIGKLQAREAEVMAGVVLGAGGGSALLGLAAFSLLRHRARLTEAEAAARRQAVRLRAAIDHRPDGIAMFDAEDRLLLWNGRFTRLAGVPDALATPGAPYAAIAAAVAWQPPLLAAARPDGPGLVGETREGGRTLEVWRGPLPDGGQLVTVADVTRRVEAEAIVRQAQRMESLGQLTGGVAHDFNNLLQVISANLELIALRARDPWLRARLDAALAGVERGAKLTRQLLAFARRQPLAPEAVDTARLLDGLADMLRPTIGDAIRLEVAHDEALWAARVDPQLLENAVLNLALNARDAMPEGGRLTIEARNAVLGPGDPARAEVPPGQYVLIAVTDTGIGMTPEQLSRAIEPFYTTKPEGQGTGLGLSMVYGYARQSGGDLRIESEPGRGTTVRLYVPRSEGAPSPQRRRDEPPSRSAGEVVLIVEDDAGVRASVQRALRDLGYGTLDAANAEDALALLEGGARPDVLFADLVLPGRLGARELAAAARRMIPHLAVLFTSGHAAGVPGAAEMPDPDAMLVSKPWRLEELAASLRVALGRARAAGPARRPRVLLAEDDPLVQAITADLLAELGYDVTGVATGSEALRALERGADLLIADLGLPDMDGRHLVEQVRQSHPGLPVVVASGRQPDPEARITWLQKPYDGAALRRALAEAGSA